MIVLVCLGIGILVLVLAVYLIRRIDKLLREEDEWVEGFIKFRDDDIDDDTYGSEASE